MIQDCAAQLAKLNATFKTGKTLPVEFRIKQLKQLQKLVKENEKGIVDALTEDLGEYSNSKFMNDLIYLILLLSTYLPLPQHHSSIIS